MRVARTLAALTAAHGAYELAEAGGLWQPGEARWPLDMPVDHGPGTYAGLMRSGDSAWLWTGLLHVSLALWGLAVSAQLSPWLRRRFRAVHEFTGVAVVALSLNVAGALVAIDAKGETYSLPLTHPVAPFVLRFAVWLRAAVLAAAASYALVRGMERQSGGPNTDKHWASALRVVAAGSVEASVWVAMHAVGVLIRIFSSLDAWTNEVSSKQLYGCVYWCMLLLNVTVCELVIGGSRFEERLKRTAEEANEELASGESRKDR